MTSSVNNLSHSLPIEKDLSDFEQEAKTTNQKQQDMLNDDIAHSDERNAEKAEECAQHPEPKITMTSPSPDVVIATVENSIPESESAEAEAEAEANDSESFENYNSDNIDDNQHTIHSSDNYSQAQTPTTTPVESNSDSSEPALESALDNADSDVDLDQENQIESEDESTDEDEVDEVKKEKEAKLESYKQFIAEQFSNQKVDYPKVRLTIEANALPSKMYFVMNTLSAIIASYGLITNSAAVVIGAMLVAMMLGPITGAALAIIDYRMPLLRRSLFTVASGVSLVILVGFIVGYIHQGQPLSSEILSRTQPTSMDLMIALAGGTAGAYAMVSPHLSVAVVGVAVATALVPPLAASGILFANGEMTLGLGAALLALTNIIAIQFTNAMVLWFLGFRRLVADDYKSSTYLTFFRRNAVALLLLVGLGIYLTINLNISAKQQTFENNVKGAINTYFMDKGNVLTNTQFEKVGGYQTVRAVIRGEKSPTSYDVQKIEAVITQDMADNFPDYLPIKLQLRYLPVQVIESDPLIQNQLDQTDAAILTK